MIGLIAALALGGVVPVGVRTHIEPAAAGLTAELSEPCYPIVAKGVAVGNFWDLYT